MAGICVSGTYFPIFRRMRLAGNAKRLWPSDASDVWLCATLAMGGMVYALNYAVGGPSTQFLTLLACTVLGQGFCGLGWPTD